MAKFIQNLKINLGFWVLWGFLSNGLANAESIIQSPEADRFRKTVFKQLGHPCLKHKNYGLKIVSLHRNDTLFQVNEDRKFIPASNLKLVTTAAALKNLGPNFRFSTELYTTGNIENGILRGNLYIKGFGDPKLVTEQIWLLANRLKNQFVRKVEGDILADDSYFDAQRRIKTWKKKSGPQAYNAPLGALSFNFNTVKVLAQPASKPGLKPIVIVDPDTSYIRITNQAVTVPWGRKNGLIVNRLDRVSFNDIILTGTMRQDAARAKYYLNITDPPFYTGTVFKEVLGKAGVEVSGKVRLGKVPEGARRIVLHRSEPLALILRGLNKFSNNFVAEQLVKTIAAVESGEPGTTANGVQVISRYLRSLGISGKEFVILDGSGLSDKNRLTPNQIIAVLRDAFRSLSVYPEFIASLAVMGVDGSVKNRLINLPEASRARVKTGTLDRVSALSGYFQSKEGERFAFSMLMNDLRCNINNVLKIQDRIIAEGLNLERKTNVNMKN